MLTILLTCLAIAQAPTPALTVPPAPTAGIVQVGTAARRPYSWQAPDGTWTGPAVQLWSTIALDCGIQYELKGYTESELFAKLQDKSIDFAATGVQINALADLTIDFTAPFDAGGYSLVTHGRSAALPREVIARVMTPNVLVWLVFMGIATAVAGVAIRVIERDQNPTHLGAKDRLINGLWWAITTLSTVGYGDFVPKTRLGKLVGSLWMVVSLILVAIFTANIVATLTVGRLTPYFQSIKDMRVNLVGIIDLPSSRDVATRLGLVPRIFHTPTDAFEALDNGQIEGFLHPTNEVRVLLNERQDPNLILLPRETLRGFVALGVSESFDKVRLRQINSAIIRVIESQAWTALAQQLDGSPPSQD